MKSKKLIVRIVCFAVMAVIIAVLIFGNVMAFQNADVITSFLSGTGEDYSGATQELKNGDALCLQIAEDSVVLLRNEKKANGKTALPLDGDVTKLNVFGYAATDTGFLMKGVGSGSSTISEEKMITFLDAMSGAVRDFDIDKSEYTDGSGNADAQKLAELKAEFGKTLAKYELNQEILKIYDDFAKGSNKARPHADKLSINDDSGTAYRLDEPDVKLFTQEIMERAAAESDVAVFVIGRDGGENIGEQPKYQTVGGNRVNDRTYLDITSQEEAMLKLLNTYFSTTVVVLNTTNAMHLGFLDDPALGVDACLYLGLPGQSGARAIPEILSGKINPSGKYTDIVTRSGAVAKLYDPTYANNEAVNKQIHYAEDIYYGYKWYETADAEGYFESLDNPASYDEIVMYPFGHGLSYTEFTQSIESLSYTDNGTTKTLANNAAIDSVPVGATIKASVKVTNSGSVAGKDVVQLYYTPPYNTGKADKIEKAEINLLGFAKTDIIESGRSQTVDVEFTLYDMASYDCYDANKNGFKGYELDGGTYEIKLMKNSHTAIESVGLKLNDGVMIEEDPVTHEKVVNRFVGDGAYAGLGTDGAYAGVSQNWLSRADFKGTFPKTRSTGYTNSSKVNAAANYVNNKSYENVDLTFTQNADSGLYLWTQAGEKATLEQLTGRGNSQIAPDYELMSMLADYDAEELWNEFLDQMNIAEMKKLIEMGGFGRKATASVGLRELYDYDGPAGFNTASRGSDTGEWTAYPSESLIGCSWNERLMFLMGRMMGAEAQATTVHGWYAPGVNLHRSNYNARNFEYYSEDAVLSGKLAVQVIAGAKTNGLACYLKHFACSEEGPNPQEVNTWITEQNLRENYLRPFEIAVKGIDIDLSDEESGTQKTLHVGANAMMTAFNRVGASWAGAHYGMNVSVLREEWGFKGTLITDWTTIAAWGNSDVLGNMNVHQGIRCGNDLWLDPNDNNRSLDTSDPIDRYCARVACKNILYTVADTMDTYNTVVTSGVELDKYQTTLSDRFKHVTSWWQPVLITVDVLVVLGFIVWAVFLLVPVKQLIQNLKAKKAGAAGDTEATEATEQATDATPSDDKTE